MLWPYDYAHCVLMAIITIVKSRYGKVRIENGAYVRVGTVSAAAQAEAVEVALTCGLVHYRTPDWLSLCGAEVPMRVTEQVYEVTCVECRYREMARSWKLR